MMRQRGFAPFILLARASIDGAIVPQDLRKRNVKFPERGVYARERRAPPTKHAGLGLTARRLPELLRHDLT